MGRMSREEAYEVLGLQGEENEEEIKRAYRKMSLATHPDKNPGDPEATQKFQEVGEAYMCLTQEDYDCDGDGEYSDDDSDDDNGHGRRYGGYRGRGMSAEDFMDLFSEMFFYAEMSGGSPFGRGGRGSIGVPPGFGFGLGPRMGPGGTAYVYMPSPGGGSRSMHGSPGQRFYEDDDSDDDDGYEYDYFNQDARRVRMQQNEAEQESKRIAKQKRDLERAQKRREEEEKFWKLQQERAKARHDHFQKRMAAQAAAKERARVKAEKAKQQRAAEEEEEAAKAEARKREKKERRKAELDAKAEKLATLRGRAFDLAMSGDRASLQALVEAKETADLGPGISVKLSDRQKDGGRSGATLLHMCVVKSGEDISEVVKTGRLDVATYLVQGIVREKGGHRDRVDLSKVDEQGLNVMHRAADEGDEALLNLLLHERTRSAALKMEADLSATCLEKGWTPLMYAANGGHSAAATLLLEAGARIKQPSNPTVTGMAVPQQTALEICQSALSWSQDSERTERLAGVLVVLQEAVDKVERANKEKEAEKQRKQKQEELEAQKSSGKQSLEQELLERKRLQLLERQRKQEEEEAKAARKKEEAEWEKKEQARLKREKKKEKREKEKKEAQQLTFIKEQEECRAEFHMYGNRGYPGSSSSSSKAMSEQEQVEHWEMVTSAKHAALEKEEGERKQAAQEKLMRAAQNENKLLSSLERYEKALKAKGYALSDEEDKDMDNDSNNSVYSATAYNRASPPPNGRPPCGSSAGRRTGPAGGAGAGRGRGAGGRRNSTSPSPPGYESPFQTPAPSHGSSQRATGPGRSDCRERRRRGGRGGGDGEWSGRPGRGGRGGGASRPPRSPDRGQVRSVEAGGWGEAAQVQDGVNGWGCEGHPDVEGVLVKAVPLTGANERESSGWGQPDTDPSAASVSNDGWGAAAAAAPKSAVNRTDGGRNTGGWDEGSSTAAASRNQTPVTPAASVSSRESVDWEERAERNRLQNLAHLQNSKSSSPEEVSKRPTAPAPATNAVPTRAGARAAAMPPTSSQPLRQIPQATRQQPPPPADKPPPMLAQPQAPPAAAQRQAPPPPNHPPPPPPPPRSQPPTTAPEQSQQQRRQAQPPPPPTQPPPPSGPPPPQAGAAGGSALPAGTPGLSAAANSYRPSPLSGQSGIVPSGLSASTGATAGASVGLSVGAGAISAASPEWLPKTTLAPPPGMIPAGMGNDASGVAGLDSTNGVVDVSVLEAQMTPGVPIPDPNRAPNLQTSWGQQQTAYAVDPGRVSPENMAAIALGLAPDASLDAPQNTAQSRAALEMQAILNAGLLRGILMSQTSPDMGLALAGRTPQQAPLFMCPYCGNMNPRLFTDAGQGYARCLGVYTNGAMCKGIMPWPVGALPEYKPPLQVPGQHDLGQGVAFDHGQVSNRNWQPQLQPVSGGAVYGQSPYATLPNAAQASGLHYSILLQQQAAYNAATGSVNVMGMSGSNTNALSTTPTVSADGIPRHSTALSPAAPAYHTQLQGGVDMPGYGSSVVTTTARSSPTLSSTAPVFNMTGVSCRTQLDHNNLTQAAGGVGPAPGLSSQAQPYLPSSGPSAREENGQSAPRQPLPPSSKPPPPPPSSAPPPMDSNPPTSVPEPQRTRRADVDSSSSTSVVSNQQHQTVSDSQPPQPPPQSGRWNADPVAGGSRVSSASAAHGWGDTTAGVSQGGDPSSASGWGDANASNASASQARKYGTESESTAGPQPASSSQEPSGWGEPDPSAAAAARSSSGWGTPDKTSKGTVAGGWSTREQRSGASNGRRKAAPAATSGWNTGIETASASVGESAGGWSGGGGDQQQGGGGGWGDESAQAEAPDASGWESTPSGATHNDGNNNTSSGWDTGAGPSPSPGFQDNKAENEWIEGGRRSRKKPWGNATSSQARAPLPVPESLRGPTPAASKPARHPQQGGKKAPAAVAPEKRDLLYAQLVEMGFATVDCDRALKEVGYELEPVLNWLFSNAAS